MTGLNRAWAARLFNPVQSVTLTLIIRAAFRAKEKIITRYPVFRKYTTVVMLVYFVVTSLGNIECSISCDITVDSQVIVLCTVDQVEPCKNVY